MKTASFFLMVCLILMAVGTTHATLVYTEAYANDADIPDHDYGDKPYSEASEWYYDQVHYIGIAEVQGNSLKGLSYAEVVKDDNYGINGDAFTISRMTIPLQVLSDGAISFDWSLTGELKVVLEGPGGWGFDPQYDSSYDLSIIDSVSDDFASSSDILTVTEQEGIGSYITPVELLEIYDFGGGSFSAGSIIDVTLELQTSIDAGYGYFGAGSVISSDFSDSLTFDNLVNVQVVPEPCTLSLFSVGLIMVGCRRTSRKEADIISTIVGKLN